MDNAGLYRVRNGALIPLTQRTAEMTKGLGNGAMVSVRVHVPRNPKFSALSRVVLERVAEAKGCTTDALLMWLKAETGHCDLVEGADGKIAVHPRSLDFDEMDEVAYRRFWTAAMTAICEKILPGLPKREFQEIRAILDGKRGVP